MSEIVDQDKLEQITFGTPLKIADDAVMTITTVNRTLGVVETDAFQIDTVTLIDRAATELVLTDVENGSRFRVTYEYLGEKESNDGE